VRVGEPGTVTVTDAAQAYQLFDQRIATKAVLYP
jgi:hypothetical protein